MSFGADEEILQDFLVEAGEILSNCPSNWSSWKADRTMRTCSMQFFAVSTL